MLVVTAYSPEPSIRVGKNPAHLHHTERGAAGYIEGSF